ncbi:MAG: hypothetical protein QXQ82_01375 [Candidatus Pacearchaeota archaeon]
MQLRPVRLKKVVSKEKYDDRMKIRTIEIDEKDKSSGKFICSRKKTANGKFLTFS